MINIRTRFFTTICAAAAFIAMASVAEQSLAADYNAQANQTESSKAGAYAQDTEITAKVKAKLVEDRQVRATSISVETRDGVVDLAGNARTRSEKMRAGKLAMDTKGARKVTNHIVVMQP